MSTSSKNDTTPPLICVTATSAREQMTNCTSIIPHLTVDTHFLLASSVVVAQQYPDRFLRQRRQLCLNWMRKEEAEEGGGGSAPPTKTNASMRARTFLPRARLLLLLCGGVVGGDRRRAPPLCISFLWRPRPAGASRMPRGWMRTRCWG